MADTSLMNERARLRQALRQKRQTLTSQEQNIAASKLLHTFLEHSDQVTYFAQSSPLNIALYLANDGEISPAALCQSFWQHQDNKAINTYLPVVKDDSLVFAHYHSDSVWQKNKFGIAEPVDTAPIQGMSLDIVFLPLVGFDKTGARLGMGGGFYDKTFAKKTSTNPPSAKEQANHSPILIGLAHDCQQTESLPIESWDVPLDAIMTDSQYIKIR